MQLKNNSGTFYDQKALHFLKKATNFACFGVEDKIKVKPPFFVNKCK
jgi:hypothetical protein